MPVGWIIGVPRVIEDCDGDFVPVRVPGQGAPAAAGSLGLISLLALTGQIDTRCAGCIGSWNLRRPAIRVGEGATFLIGRLQPTCCAYAQQTFLVVVKHYPIERVQSSDRVDHPLIVFLRKYVARLLLDNVLATACSPYRVDDQFPAVTPAFGGDNFLLVNGPHLGAVFRLDGVGVIPEVESVYVTVIEPNSRMMRMIDPLTRARRERKATDHVDAIGGDQGIQHRLLQRTWPDVRGEGLAVDGDIDALMGLVRNYLHALLSQPLQSTDCQQAAEEPPTHRPCLRPSPAVICHQR